MFKTKHVLRAEAEYYLIEEAVRLSIIHATDWENSSKKENKLAYYNEVSKLLQMCEKFEITVP